MITEVFLNIIYGLVALILTPVQLIFQPLGSMAGLVELFSYASIFIPTATFGLCMSVWLAYYGIKFGIVVVNWSIAKIPTID